MNRRSIVILLFVFLMAGAATAQMTITGAISGTVVDPTGQVVAGAKVTITSARTAEPRTTLSNESGSFGFVAIQLDNHSLRVEREGFKTYERRSMAVNASERVSTGDIALQFWGPPACAGFQVAQVPDLHC